METGHQSLALEILIRIILVVTFHITDDAVPYFRKIQKEEQWLYRYPRTPSFYPGYILWVTVLTVPVLMVMIFLFIRRDRVDAKQALLCASLAIFLTGCVTNFIKLGVGRPRPDFLERCFPDGQIRDDMNCTGRAKDVIQGYKSFPSGHSSFAFSSLGFTALYFAGKMHIFNRNGHGNSLKICLFVSLLIWATLIAVSRTADFHHHWQDVTVGSILGMTLTYFCYHQYYPALSRSVSHLPYISLPSERDLIPTSPVHIMNKADHVDSLLKMNMDLLFSPYPDCYPAPVITIQARVHPPTHPSTTQQPKQVMCQQPLKDPCVLITNDDYYRVPTISSGVNQQPYYHTGPSLGLEEDLPIPDFNHLPSSLEEEDNNNHTNTLRSAIFQKILNSYPQLNRKLKRSHHVAKKFQQAPGNLSDCVYQTSLTPESTDDAIIGDLASSIMDDEFDGGYCSFSDNASVNSSGSISPNSSAVELLQQKLLSDVDVKSECSKFENFDNITKPCENAKTKPVTFLVKTLPKPAKYQCNVCGKSYKGNTNLNYHMATHTGIRPHKCSICGKAFTQKSTLRTHFRIHTGEKPYKCRTCVRAFADYSTCMKHERTHSGEKPYACPVCGKCFAQSGNMLRHRQTHRKN
ncbi:uncharacterized protein LOC133193022 [Saccostrea echinata]|uniref:uncharacterized protein LOC133193022 n=1 Tax=Saccostrea echinata TaxID=191078 RepID=UPI002A838454|nr:uncharacterized protein LOC133193022 [Saccostrea echinata]